MNLLFVENAEEHGNGKNRIVSREMYPKLVGFRKKWEKYEFSAIVQLFLVVLKQTSFLSSTMEIDAILIYQLYDAIKETIEKLNEIANESSVEYPYLPKNLKEVEENEDGNVIVEASALNMSQKKYDKLSGEKMVKIVITKDSSHYEIKREVWRKLTR